jgi:predicted HD phosphohydrolase
MDTGTAEDWASLQRATARWQLSLPDRIRSLLAGLAEQRDGMAIDQLQHSLQTATRSLRAGASEELIVGALCHDIGTGISYDNHAAISAEILAPYVSRNVYQIVRTHQEFQRAHYHERFGKKTEARLRYAKKPWFRDAERFSDEWDQAAFDPDYDSMTLEYFAPLIDSIFNSRRGHRNGGQLRDRWSQSPDFWHRLKNLKRLVVRGRDD